MSSSAASALAAKQDVKRERSLRQILANPALRNFTWLFGDKVLSVVLGLLVFGLIARTFGTTGAGHFGYAVALLQTALGLSLVCSAAAVLPRFWRMRTGQMSALGNVFAVRLGGAVLAMASAMLYCALAVDDPTRRTISLILLAAVPLVEPFYVASVYWQARNQNAPPVIARSSGLIVRALAVWAGIAFGVPVWVIALAWVLEAALSASLQSASVLRQAPLRAIARAVTRARAATYLRFGVRFMLGLWFSHVFLRIDRLLLSERMSTADFGIYATAMQVTEAWIQVAYVTSSSIAPAFVYHQLSTAQSWRAHWKTVAGLLALGLSGLLGAVLLGRPFLTVIFGEPFAASHAYLIAGTAFAALMFVDQFVQIAITSSNRPWLLALKWGVSCLVAVPCLLLWFKSIGAFAGPASLAAGLCAGWVALLLWRAMYVMHVTRGPSRH